MLLPIRLLPFGNMHLMNDLISWKLGGVYALTVEPSNLIPNLSIVSAVNMWWTEECFFQTCYIWSSSFKVICFSDT